jgi:6-phosphogluconate dehydrogenase
MPKADIGLIGLAVMGENLVLNMESHGYRVAVYNRTVQRVDEFLKGRAKGKKIVGAHSLLELVDQLKRPRLVMIMVKAGAAVDAVISQLEPLLEQGDVIIDGGNSHYPDTVRRATQAKEKGLLYLGVGVSGGEEGALKGPSIMPGGEQAAWPLVRPIFQSIAAQVEGRPCCEWVGPAGAGHFVKMVHNGIEYGDIQLICESYHLLSALAGCDAAELRSIFQAFNRGKLQSYLIEITADIFGFTDPETGRPLIDLIMDRAGQKGTGKWTVDAATELNVALTLISEAVFARFLSAQKEERVMASSHLPGPKQAYTGNKEEFVRGVEQALYASKIVSYAQGFALMHAMSQAKGWPIDRGSVALMWRGGCIIRSAFLGRIKEAFERNPDLPNLLVDPYFAEELGQAQAQWRRIVSTGALHGIPLPAFSAALAYYDGYRTARLPANLLQAQRDYFGAHTYERIDRPAGEFFHTNWTGRGGTTSSTTYSS